jgi:formyltetrahydrofolate deformylase
MNAKSAYILTLACADRVGIVAAVSGHLAAIDGFILDSQQYADLDVNRFFMRVEFAGAGAAFPPDCCALKAGLEPIAARFGMTWDVVAADARPKLIIAVSRASHCLNDLLHRRHTGTLPVEIAGVVSNHDDLRSLTQWYGVPYHHLPIEPGGKARHEAAIEQIVASTGADYLVLARYMQVLTPELTDRLAGRCIKIPPQFSAEFQRRTPLCEGS